MFSKIKKYLMIIKTKILVPFKPKIWCLKQVKYRGVSLLVSANEDIGWRIITKKSYEESELKLLEKIIEADDVCLDIGGNIGIYTIFMARKASKGKVIVFEPVEYSRHILFINLHINQIENVKVSSCALSNHIGQLAFSVSEDSAFSSILPTERKKEAIKVSVDSETLDHLYTDNKIKVDIIKLDVEGTELMVLQGGKRLFASPNLRPRALLVELNASNEAVYGYEASEIISFLKDLGYNAYSITPYGISEGWPHERGTEDALFFAKEYEDELVQACKHSD